MKFVNKPVVVEARRFHTEFAKGGMATQALAAWCGGTIVDFAGEPRIEIDTLEGRMYASPGDWIIEEPHPTEDRRFYPVKAEIFEARYEPYRERESLETADQLPGPDMITSWGAMPEDAGEEES